MKIMQINVWQGRLLRPLLALIREESPDIICAQEIYSYPHDMAPTSPWNYLATLELISTDNNFEYIYCSPCSTFTMFDQKLSYGNAILSKNEFIRTATHYTGGTGPMHYDEPAKFASNATRNFQHVVVKTDGPEVNVINLHGHWTPLPEGDEVSVEKLNILAQYVKKLSGPVVLAGDFNLSATSLAMSNFIKDINFQDANLGAKSTLSIAHYVKNIACDYVLVNPAVKIIQSKISSKLVSDHMAIITQIDY